MSACPTCRRPWAESDVPPEPPVGTWVVDRHGGTHYRTARGWAAAPNGFHPGGRWAVMWQARGPLVECGPYGEER